MSLLVLLFVMQDPSTLRVGWAKPSTLDPAKGATLADARVLSALYEGLVTFEADGITPAPGAAERWETSEDGLVWTFHLRDAKGSDGEPVTAGDFVSAWRRLLDPAVKAAYPDTLRPFRNVGDYTDGARAERILAELEISPEGDARTLVRTARIGLVPRLVKLAARSSGDLKKLLEDAAQAAKSRKALRLEDLGFEAIDPKTLRLTLERPAPWLLQTLGFMALYPVKGSATNGPYRVEKSEEGSLSLIRVRGSGPEKVVLSFCKPEEAIARFDRGEIDWLDAESMPPEKLLKLAERKEFRYFDLWGTWFLRANAERDPFRRVEVRRAFARATDRAPLVEIVHRNASTSLVPPGFPGYRSPEIPRFSKSAAMESLLAAYPDITSVPAIELLAPDDSRLLAEALAKQWTANLGLAVNVKAMKAPAYARALAAGQYDLALCAWVGEFFDPASFLEPWTETIEAADPAKRMELLARAERKLLADDALAIPLYTMGTYALISNRVKGVAANPLGRVLLEHVRAER